MMDPSFQPSTAGKQHPSALSREDDDTEATPPKGERNRNRGHAIQEKTLKFRFPPSKSNDSNVNPLILHIHWMHEVKTAFGDGVVFLDNNNRKIDKLDPLRSSHESLAHHLVVHSQTSDNIGKTTGSNGATTRFITHRIQSKHPLSEIKGAPNVADLMQKYDFYVNEHRWCETDWDTTQLGFFYDIDPQFYDLDQATCKIQEVFKQNVPRMKVPRFRLVYCSPRVRTSNRNNRVIRTKAYAIETLRKDRDDMTRLLKQAYKDNGTFVPFQMRARHPEAFEKMIRAQTHRLANNFVIILNYVGPDVMHYISERILTMKGVQALLPCKSVNVDGKYKISVRKEQYHTTRSALMTELTKWINDNAAPDAKATLAKYPSSPEVAPISSDGFSSGEYSYMNISINTAFSVGSAISDTSPPAFIYQDSSKSFSSAKDSTLGDSRSNSSSRVNTWANVTAGRDAPTTEHSEIGQTSIDQSTIISDLESSRAEVETLKSKVAHLEAERAEQQRLLAETVREQVSKAVQDQMSMFTVQMTQLFANLVTTMHHAPGTTPKRTVQDMETDTSPDQRMGENTSDKLLKKRDNKNTPINISTIKESNKVRDAWDTPDYLEHIASQPDSSDFSTPPQKQKFMENTTSKDEENRGRMSESEDDDSTKTGSGNESIHKSLANIMEVEARAQKHERK